MVVEVKCIHILFLGGSKCIWQFNATYFTTIDIMLKYYILVFQE